ncbi:MAG: phospholipase D family protein, partial [Candidatus Binatia bacterium]
RLLLDDIYGSDDRDLTLTAVDAHPNIEIRSFNPLARRKLRVLDFAIDAGRINYRMHNKTMIADNTIAIVGGRNIADEYFGVRSRGNYRDLDVNCAGPIVGDISDSFDLFWNSQWALPMGALLERPMTAEELEEVTTELVDLHDSVEYPYPIDEDVEETRLRLQNVGADLVWADAEVIYDLPDKVGRSEKTGPIRDSLQEHLRNTHSELLIEAAYFVPTRSGVDTARALVERGVTVRVLTNSLASNDVVAAHSGHANHRMALVEAGAGVYELRPDPEIKAQWTVVSGRSKAALHTKAVVFDRESVFIGSYNLDPRSAYINTEIGVMIDSPELAGKVGEFMDGGVVPANAYRLVIEDPPRGHYRKQGPRLVWLAETNGEPVRYRVDPETTWWKRFVAGFIGVLPIESQL